MGNLIISTFITLDGVQENPQDWSLDFWSVEYGRYARDLLFEADALIMGRVTYEGFSQTWPTVDDAGTPMAGYASRMNSIRKYVVSQTLDKVAWTSTELLEGDLVPAVRALKQQHEGAIVAYGSGGVARALAGEGLVDEFRLWIHPVVLGKGESVFASWPTTQLDLVSQTQLPNGVIVLSYRPKKTA
ncbi:dihydrofolate reductase family protein [Dactylosporangium sp. NPDC000555]|uniref:dihydrofolate reductase family protein n=1 Tax=Dactylosporangium sp. NPDC000555 TaxID=3154260 RepID=UPI003323086E